jgi:hypothetical protein
MVKLSVNAGDIGYKAKHAMGSMREKIFRNDRVSLCIWLVICSPGLARGRV